MPSTGNVLVLDLCERSGLESDHVMTNPAVTNNPKNCGVFTGVIANQPNAAVISGRRAGLLVSSRGTGREGAAERSAALSTTGTLTVAQEKMVDASERLYAHRAVDRGG